MGVLAMTGDEVGGVKSMDVGWGKVILLNHG